MSTFAVWLTHRIILALALSLLSSIVVMFVEGVPFNHTRMVAALSVVLFTTVTVIIDIFKEKS
jgi:hypothetical protein